MCTNEADFQDLSDRDKGLIGYVSAAYSLPDLLRIFVEQNRHIVETNYDEQVSENSDAAAFHQDNFNKVWDTRNSTASDLIEIARYHWGLGIPE